MGESESAQGCLYWFGWHLRERPITAPLEIRDSETATRFVLEGLLFQCVQPPHPDTVQTVLDWYLEAAVEGFPLPPIGVVADVGHLAFGEEHARSEESLAPPSEPLHLKRFPLPSTVIRQYEDLFLGKLYTDRTFDRGVDGLRRYSDPRDRAKALAFLLRQIGQRAGYRGAHLSPGVIRNLSRLDGPEVLIKASKNLTENGPLNWDEVSDEGGEASDTGRSLMEVLYGDLSHHLRNLGEVLGVEDVFELEHGTAIAGFGQRIALRQVLRAAAELESGVPHQPVRPLNRRQQVATKIVDEDTYPIGGFSSISNKGTIESLLHSQLAYMENDERPDMFDIKFLRDELLYYARDENQFLRRRRTFVFALFPDLVAARLKDQHLPWQRIVLLLSLLLVAVRKLIEWLSEDALVFEFVFIQPKKKKAGQPQDLTKERELLEVLFREEIANGVVKLSEMEFTKQFAAHCDHTARRSLCHCVLLSTKPHSVEIENTLITQLRLDGPIPEVSLDDGKWEQREGELLLEQWTATLVYLLAGWVAG